MFEANSFSTIRALGRPDGGMVDATDLKSVIDYGVWVRIPPLAPIHS